MSSREPDRLPAEQAGALYVEYGQPLTAFALGLLRDRELAREVVQVTFRQALEHAGEIPAEGRKAWLFKVARNEALAIRRRAGVTRRVHAELADEQRGEAVDAPPDVEFLRREQVEEVRRALELLPDAQRSVVEEKFFQGRTFAEIAVATGLPLGTVLTRMRLALGKLEQRLKHTR